MSKEEKQPWIRIAIRKTDTLKILLMVLWETKSLDNKKYVAVSTPLNEIGKMLGGWNGQVTKKIEEIKVNLSDTTPVKQNSPSKKPEEK